MHADFPTFSPLRLTDRPMYEQHMRKYPPLSDLSFTTLMIWWNFARDLKVAELRGNLVLRYNLPSDPHNSGLSFAGTNRVDDSIATLLDGLRAAGEPERLIHVPEFAVAAIQQPARFTIEAEDDYAEYIFPTERFYPTEGLDTERRRSIARFIEAAGTSPIEIKELDLSKPRNAALLLDKTRDWQKNSFNDPSRNELRAMGRSVGNSKELGLHNRCLFIGGELCGFIVFQVSHDGMYIIGNHLKGKPGLAHVSTYLECMFGRAAAELGISLINLEMDLGIPGLRFHKSKMKPVGFFHKYRITYAANL